jgi:cyclase
LIRVGGHTAATSVVWLPEEKILFVGDAVWVDQHPYMAQANSKEWLDGLTYIRKLKADNIVPGRGSVCDREATDRMSEYIRTCSQVRAYHRQGKNKQETIVLVLREVAGWFPIASAVKSKTESQIKQGIGRIWNEMERAARLQEVAAAVGNGADAESEESSEVSGGGDEG